MIMTIIRETRSNFFDFMMHISCIYLRSINLLVDYLCIRVKNTQCSSHYSYYNINYQKASPVKNLTVSDY